MDFQKLLKIIAALIGVISIAFLVTIISTGNDAIKAGESSTSIGWYIYYAELVCFLAFSAVTIFGYKSQTVRWAVAIAILLPMFVSLFIWTFPIKICILLIPFAKFIDLVLDFPNSKSMLIGVSSFTLFALIAYFIFASGNEIILKDGSVLTVFQSKLVGAGLYLFYFLSFIAAGTMLYFGVKKSLNK